jgi:predicted 2-oxoglutarate/Fe(II)-dependent dioxygenase YbiX
MVGHAGEARSAWRGLGKLPSLALQRPTPHSAESAELMTLLQTRRPSLAITAGDVSPATHGVTFDGAFYSVIAQAGRPAAIILIGDLPASVARPLVAAFQRRAGEFAAHEADVVALIDMQNPQAPDFGALGSSNLATVFCKSEVLRPWGFSGHEPAVIVTDRGLRTIDIVDTADPATAAEAALARVAALPVEAACDIVLPAPVLPVQGIFSRAFCRELIDHFEASPYTRGGMASRDAGGALVHKIDETKKRRHDLVLGPRDPFLGPVSAALARTCLPEIRKAFNVDVRHTDRILIARYDDGGGYFLRHRDNAAPGVEFRQFALSINLNSEEYEGGHLLFPEYNSHRYKPGTGAGVVFSCSLLHEAARVTKGRRYVVLTFLHDAASQARRLASLQS